MFALRTSTKSSQKRSDTFKCNLIKHIIFRQITSYFQVVLLFLLVAEIRESLKGENSFVPTGEFRREKEEKSLKIWNKKSGPFSIINTQCRAWLLSDSRWRRIHDPITNVKCVRVYALDSLLRFEVKTIFKGTLLFIVASSHPNFRTIALHLIKSQTQSTFPDSSSLFFLNSADQYSTAWDCRAPHSTMIYDLALFYWMW